MIYMLCYAILFNYLAAEEDTFMDPDNEEYSKIEREYGDYRIVIKVTLFLY